MKTKVIPFYNRRTIEKDKSVHVTFRVSSAVLKKWKEETSQLGVADFSAFIRGAIYSAIDISQRAEESSWKKFMEEMQPIARKHFGHGFALTLAKTYEANGSIKFGISAEEFLKKIRRV